MLRPDKRLLSMFLVGATAATALVVTSASASPGLDQSTTGQTVGLGAAPSVAPAPQAQQSVIWGRVRAKGARRLLADAVVQAFDVQDPSQPVATSLTYEGYGYGNGVFALYVPPGTYDVKVAPPAGTARKSVETGAVTVVANEVRDLGVVVLPFPPGITVRANDALTGQDLAGATAVLTSRVGINRTVTTSSDGRARFRNLVPGRYVIAVSAAGHVVRTLRLRFEGDPRYKHVLLPVAPTAAPGQGVIWGRIVRNEQERLVDDVLVQAVDQNGAVAASSLTYEGYGFAHGVFVLYVPPGEYSVRALPRPGLGRAGFDTANVQVADGDVIDLAQLSLRPLPGIAVRVVDSVTGSPLLGADVVLTSPDGAVSRLLTTIRGGRVRFKPLTDVGTYLVSASKDGYVSATTQRTFFGGRKHSVITLVQQSGNGGGPVQTPTVPPLEATPTFTPEPTATASPTSTPSATPTATATPTTTATPTATPTATSTGEPVEPAESKIKGQVEDRKIARGERGELLIRITSLGEQLPTGEVVVEVGRKSVTFNLTELDEGVLEVVLPKLKPGRYAISVTYSGDEFTEPQSKDFGSITVDDEKDKKGKGGKGGRAASARIGGPLLAS